MVEEKLQITGVSKHFVKGYGHFAMNSNGSMSTIKVGSFGGSFLTTLSRSWLVSRCGRQVLV